MKIALLAPRFPYPARSRRSASTITKMLELFSRDHEVTLFAFLDGTEPPEALERVSGCAMRSRRSLPRARSWLRRGRALFGAHAVAGGLLPLA
jgi:hypothetical protein